MKRIFFFLVIPMVISNIVPSYSLAITQKKTKWNNRNNWCSLSPSKLTAFIRLENFFEILDRLCVNAA